MLGLQDSLGLTEDQAARIEALSDSLDAKNRTLAEALQREIEEAGPQQNARALVGLIQPRIQEARVAAQNSLEDLREILSEEQWEMLPEAVKSPAEALRRLRGGRRR